MDGLLLSCGGGALQKHQSADVVGEVLKPDLDLRTHDANRADESTAGRILLRPEHMLDTGAHLALAVVCSPLRLWQWTIASPAFVNAAPEAPHSKLLLRLGRAMDESW